jgi:2-dehydropantoate 2-reductase
MSNCFPDIKRVCIYGTGGVGGYFGGRIAEVLNNNPQFEDYEIYFIARGEHLKAIKQHGIVVKTPDRTINAKPNLATDDINEIPPADLILLCVKDYDLNQAAVAIKPAINENTVIMPLLNGIDIVERIRMILHKGLVLPACLYLGTHIESPGVINQSGGNGIIIFGPDPQQPEYSGENVKNYFQKTAVQYDWNNDPLPKIWEKYLFIAAFGLVTGGYGESLGAVVKNEKHWYVVRSLMEEIYAISKMKKINLPEDIIEKSMRKAANFPSDARTSYQRDIESGSKNNEGDLYGGTIIREGKALGVATPVTEAVYQRIKDLYGEPV